MLRRKKIGRGSYGIVYEMVSPGGKSEFAFKRNVVEDITTFSGVIRELDILNILNNHPNIVYTKYISIGNPFSDGILTPLDKIEFPKRRDDIFHFVFEKGETDLHEWLNSTPIDFSETYYQLKSMITDMLLGVEYMHGRGVIHRDLKTTNLLVCKGNEIIMRDPILKKIGLLKICDFGLSKPFIQDLQLTPNVMTVWYRAPEVASGMIDYTLKVDIWSIGCIMFEMLFRYPFVGRSSDDDNTVLLNSIFREVSFIPHGNDLFRLGHTTQLHKKKRKTMYQRIQSNDIVKKLVGTDAKALSDIIDSCLQIIPENRPSATTLLNKEFFNSFRERINTVRLKSPAYPITERKYLIQTGMERWWGIMIAACIYNGRYNYRWYTHRRIFHAISMFDRFLISLKNAKESGKTLHDGGPVMIETDSQGKYLEKSDAELYFIACLYISIKYFSSLQEAIPFGEVAPPGIDTVSNQAKVQNFEICLIRDTFRYRIYEPTHYEALILANRNTDININTVINAIVSGKIDFIDDMKPSESIKLILDK